MQNDFFQSTLPQIDHADGNEGAPPSHIMPTSSSSSSDHSLRSLGARRKLNLTDVGIGGAVAGAASEGVLVGGVVGGARISGSSSSIGGGAAMVGTGTPMKERDHSSSLVGQLITSFCVYKFIGICSVYYYILDPDSVSYREFLHSILCFLVHSTMYMYSFAGIYMYIYMHMYYIICIHIHGCGEL